MTITIELALQINQLIQSEGQLLDDRNWDQWLSLYEPGCEYWVPMWDDDGEPTTDPQREMSLIYYQSRSGLEDRVFRIKTGKSTASMPLFRTVHIRTSAICKREGDMICAQFNMPS